MFDCSSKAFCRNAYCIILATCLFASSTRVLTVSCRSFTEFKIQFSYSGSPKAQLLKVHESLLPTGASKAFRFYLSKSGFYPQGVPWRIFQNEKTQNISLPEYNIVL